MRASTLPESHPSICSSKVDYKRCRTSIVTHSHLQLGVSRLLYSIICCEGFRICFIVYTVYSTSGVAFCVALSMCCTAPRTCCIVLATCCTRIITYFRTSSICLDSHLLTASCVCSLYYALAFSGFTALSIYLLQVDSV